MSRSERFGLFCLLACALAVRLAYCHWSGGIGRSVPDCFREYAIVAEQFLSHGVLSSPLVSSAQPNPQPSDLLPPAYVGIVALTFKLLGTQTFAAILALHLLNATATSLAAVVAVLIARRLAGNVAGWLAGVLVTLHPLAVGYTDYIWDTALFTLGVALSIWGSLRLSAEPIRRTGSFFWFGVGLGLLAMLNPAWTPAYPLLVLWPLARRRAELLPRQALKATGLAMIGWALALAPWTARNYLNVGQLSYVRGGLGFEFWLGVCPEVDGDGNVYLSQYPLLNAAQQQRVTTLGEQAFVREASTRAWNAIRADPMRFARLSWWRLNDFWTGSVLSHTDGNSRLPAGKRAWLTWLLSAEISAVGLLFLAGGMSRDLRWLIGMLALFSMLYSLTHVELRFRAPITPVMGITLACATWAAIRVRYRAFLPILATQR